MIFRMEPAVCACAWVDVNDCPIDAALAMKGLHEGVEEKP